jgi:molybdopterin-guanine dinucleotide biosynthesis protein A
MTLIGTSPAIDRWPVFAVCGFSGAGKTTLIVALVRRLAARGLATLVIKHDAHGLHVDREGKDTQRFFAAGADVMARSSVESFTRIHQGDAQPLHALIAEHGHAYDVIIVEGHKTTPLANKIWLRRSARDVAPRGCGPLAMDLGRDDDRAAAAWTWIEQGLSSLHASTPTLAGILIGGQSRRMGTPKHLLKHRGRTWLGHVVAAAGQATDGVVLLGAGHVPPAYAGLPRLPDVVDREGPIAGMSAALRWAPRACWVFLACDTPLVTGAALSWLRQQSKPGIWAVQPRLSAKHLPEPMPGWYDFRARAALASAQGPSWIARHPRTATPVLPDGLASAWLNCNTPASLRRLHRPRR